MNANQCLILDDDELEKVQEEGVNPRDLRTWVPTGSHSNPFNSQYISTAHSFPKVFHMKHANNYKEEFPKLSEREGPVVPPTTMNYRSRLLQKPSPMLKPANLSTINVLERVREVLHDVSGQDVSVNTMNSSLVKCRKCDGNHWTLSCPQKEEERYSPHTPPYPPDSPPYPNRSPPFPINTPPINQIIYPIGTFLSTPIPPSTTPQ
jgi:hypothetical protein